MTSSSMSQPMSILTSHQSQDWYTPPKYIELVREVLGTIELDPASDELPQSWIQSSRIFMAPDPTTNPIGGLGRPWHAKTVFCNPPYGKENGKSSQAVWSAKMVAEYRVGNFREGILLVNSTHGYKWYEELWTRWPVCLVRDRIRFINSEGVEGGQAKRGQTFVYFGRRGAEGHRFRRVFSQIGRVLLPE